MRKRARIHSLGNLSSLTTGNQTTDDAGIKTNLETRRRTVDILREEIAKGAQEIKECQAKVKGLTQNIDVLLKSGGDLLQKNSGLEATINNLASQLDAEQQKIKELIVQKTDCENKTIQLQNEIVELQNREPLVREVQAQTDGALNHSIVTREPQEYIQSLEEEIALLTEKIEDGQGAEEELVTALEDIEIHKKSVRKYQIAALLAAFIGGGTAYYYASRK